MNMTDNYNSFNNCTDNENDEINIIFKYLLLSIPPCIFLLCLLSLIIWTILKPLLPNKLWINIYIQLIQFAVSLADLMSVEKADCSFFIISQEYYELPKRTIRPNGNISDKFKPNNFRDVQNLYQDKASMDKTLDEFKYLTSTCWDKKISTSNH